MNYDDMIRMAREAGMRPNMVEALLPELERFAAAAYAAGAAAYAAGAAAENEACAKVADQGAKYNKCVSKLISIAIRARGQTS